MNEIIVPFISFDGTNTEEIKAVFKSGKAAKYAISSCNWPSQFPYKPDVTVEIAHNGSHIILNYLVTEKELRMTQPDDGNIWEDSCVEMFIMPFPESGIYYNFEINCAGNMLIGLGKDRSTRFRLNQLMLDMVGRRVAVNPQNNDGSNTWNLMVSIPKDIFVVNKFIETLSGLKCRGNFYKCGDKLQDPHFLSYAPIKTENPDFHRPEFFCDIIFE